MPDNQNTAPGGTGRAWRDPPVTWGLGDLIPFFPDLLLPLGGFYPELGSSLLVCTTEVHRKEDMDALVEGMA